MNDIGDMLWSRVQQILGKFSESILEMDRGLSCNVARLAGGAFLLRGYLAIENGENEEVAIFVSVQRDEEHVVIESDVGFELGAVIADGPSVSIFSPVLCPTIDRGFEAWIEAFSDFLESNEEIIKSAVNRGRP
ncbi:hypothetical protein [Roseateles chitinivorans]|uniref:hypothetical protein n=1 Tax=Roseateles chitinivorans TaxID=2917965 RepID=UPI003D675664